jgi:3-deoxy-7-phosphoheptulonate synthase
MGFSYLRQLPTPAEILERLPLTREQAAVKRERDGEIRAAMTGADPRFIMVIGPCSADNEEAVCEYVNKLAILQYKVKDKIIIIPRVYTNKPRTTGEGYKGMAHQPVADEEPNIIDGILAIRRLHVRVLADTGMPAADEMLYPGNYPYLEDLLGYVAVGARSVENQEHRLTASGLDIPAGMKNPTSGDLSVMLNSVQAAQKPHVFVYKNWEVATSGNPLAHSILRGAVNQYGQSIPNYHYEDLMRLSELYHKRGLANPAVIVDTNHANSGKQYREQTRIALEILHSRKKSPVLAGLVRGLMVESYLEEGAQDTAGKNYGQSITDPCLGWKDTEKLVLSAAEML